METSIDLAIFSVLTLLIFANLLALAPVVWRIRKEHRFGFLLVMALCLGHTSSLLVSITWLIIFWIAKFGLPAGLSMGTVTHILRFFFYTAAATMAVETAAIFWWRFGGAIKQIISAIRGGKDGDVR